MPPTVLGTLPSGDVSKGKGNSPLLHKIRDKESVESDLTLRGNPYVHERCPALPPAKQTRFSRQIHSRPTGPTRHVLALVAAFPCGGGGGVFGGPAGSSLRGVGQCGLGLWWRGASDA